MLKLKSLILNEKYWSKGSLAKDENNLPIDIHSKRAVKFSLLGAAIKLYVPRSKLWSVRYELCRSTIIHTTLGLFNKANTVVWKHGIEYWQDMESVTFDMIDLIISTVDAKIAVTPLKE